MLFMIYTISRSFRTKKAVKGELKSEEPEKNAVGPTTTTATGKQKKKGSMGVGVDLLAKARSRGGDKEVVCF